MLNLKYQNLNFYNPTKNNAFCKSFIVSKESHQYLGSLFLLFNIGGNMHKGSKISEIIHEIAEHEYFRTLPDETSSSVKNFERTVNKVNQAFTTLAESNHIEWVDKLHFTLASVSNNQIQFVHVGDIKIFLLRGKTLISLNKEQDKTQLKPTKIFTNIISGTLQKDDKLIFSTSEFFDYFSEENLKETFLALPPNEACFQFQESLSKEPNNVGSVSSIFIEITQKKRKNADTAKTNKTFSDYPDLNELETQNNKNSKDTSLNENFQNTLLNNLKSFYFKTSKILKKSLEPVLSKIKNSPKSESSKQLPNLNENKYNNSLSREVEKNRQYIQNWKNNRSPAASSQISEKISTLSKNLFNKYKCLSKKSRVLFLISTFLVMAFIVSIIFQAGSKDTAQKSELAEQLLAEASEKEKMAADVLIYSDFNKAKEILSEAQVILNNDEISNSGMEKEKDEILNKINSQFDKVDKIIRVNDPILVSDINSGMKIENIIGLESDVYTFDQNNNAIYQLDEAAKKLGTISQNSSNIGYFNSAGMNSAKNSILFITDSPLVAEFDLAGKEIENIDITYARSGQEITSLAIYNDRLYILDKINNQIFKHTRSISGYSKGMEWVNEGEFDLSNAKSLAIDGAVYVLDENGSVSKYLNGYLKDFNLAQLTDPLNSPSKIFTLKNYEYIYILDPNNNRFVVYDKEGELINQYASDSFTDMKDIYIDEINKKAYLLCGNKIYGIVLEIEE